MVLPGTQLMPGMVQWFCRGCRATAHACKRTQLRPGKVQRLCQARRAEHTHADLEKHLIITITIIIIIVIITIIISSHFGSREGIIGRWAT